MHRNTWYRPWRAGRRPPAARTSALMALCLLLPAAACANQDATEPNANAPALPDSVFEHVRTITLEENDEVVNVSPDVSVQEDGSFLIADGREARIRIYDSEGRLMTQFGRRGEGPGELGLPLEAMRRPDGSLVVVDLSRGILHFDSSGTRFIRGARPPMMPLYTAGPLGNDEFVVAGLRRGSADPRPLMHIWDPQADSVSFSFFPTPGDSLTRLAARNFGWADFARRGDTIAAIAAFADTVYLFDRVGSDLGQVALPMIDFKRIATYDPTATPDELDQWLETLHLLVDIWWLEDGTLLVQYQQPQDTDNEWSLLRTDLDGRRYFDLRDTLELLAAHGNLLFFVDPSSYTPNKWIVVRLR